MQFDGAIGITFSLVSMDHFWGTQDDHVFEVRRCLDDIEIGLGSDRLASIIKSGARCPLNNRSSFSTQEVSLLDIQPIKGQENHSEKLIHLITHSILELQNNELAIGGPEDSCDRIVREEIAQGTLLGRF